MQNINNESNRKTKITGLDDKNINYKFKLKSLEDFWCGLFITILMLICVYKGFCNLISFNLQSWHPFPKPISELTIYAIFLSINVLLLPLFLWTSLFKVGSYPNDGLKYGRDIIEVSFNKNYQDLFNRRSDMIENQNEKKQTSTSSNIYARLPVIIYFFLA